MPVSHVERVTHNGIQVLYDVTKPNEPMEQARGIAAQWPDPSPLGGELPPVDAFSPELIPVCLRGLVEDVTELMQTPVDYAAAAAIVSLAGCTNRRAVIFPKREDRSWGVIPNLWGAIIGPPGIMKSPVLRAVTQPVDSIEQRWRALYETGLEEFGLEREKAELRWQAWKEEYKRAAKKGSEPPTEPDRTLAQPTQQRLILMDATAEKLHEILAVNPAGVLVLRDELTGWLAELDRPGREGERAFYLQAWNGDSGFSVDRIGRGSIHVPAVCVSLFGNIQPARLRWYLSQALEGGPADDGLFQRFQLLVWPDPPRTWKLVDRVPNESARQSAARVFSSLAELSADKPVRLRFGGDGQDLFFEWWTELEAKVRSGTLHPSLTAHLSKFRSLMPSLAGLYELADRAAVGYQLDGDLVVSLDHARQAAALCEYLESHARRVYSCVVSPEMHAAHELARHVRAGDLAATFSTRDVYQRGWSGLDTPGRARAALDILEGSGWLRRRKEELSGGGRPSEVWDINPRLKVNRAP